jgi:hypothetical protein
MQQDSIDLLVWRALRGNELIVASLATLQRAKGKGLPVNEAPRLSTTDAISKLFDQRKQHAVSVASTLLLCPVPDTPVLYLYDQIRLCLLFKLNGAAITFCGILVEYALKYAIYLKENPGATSFDTSAWADFERITLDPAITRASKAGLIDARIEGGLRSFKDDLRNKYSHFNIQRITKDCVFEQVKKTNVDTGEEEVIELTPSTPTLQIIAKDCLDEKKVMQVFKFADGVVRHLFNQLPSTRP